MKLADLLKNVAFTCLSGKIDIPITDIVYDSRKAAKGCVFVCLKGHEADGHKFAASAVKQGACAVVLSDPVDLPDHVTVVRVQDTRQALAFMSAAFFGHPANSLQTIALTGTKGKPPR